MIALQVFHSLVTPATGENKFYGEYLTNAQGEDVVAGIRTPKPIAALETEMPELYKQYVDIAKNLNLVTKMFKIWNSQLNAVNYTSFKHVTVKRTAAAAVRIAVEMCEEGIITKKEQSSWLTLIQLTKSYFLALIQKQWQKLIRLHKV